MLRQARTIVQRAGTRKLLLFGAVGATGTVVNTLLLFLLTRYGSLHYLLASLLATEAAVITNFVGNHWFTFGRRAERSIGRKFLTFQLISTITIIGTLAILWLLTTGFGAKYLLVWNLVAIGIMFLANFTLNTKYTWRHGARVAAILVAVLVLAPLASADEGNTTTPPAEGDPFLEVSMDAGEGNETAQNETIEEVEEEEEDEPIQNATLTVTTTPAGATISINGDVIGESPTSPVELAPGTYEVSATLEGYEDFVGDVELEEGEEVEAEIELTPVPEAPPQDISFASTSPAGAAVTIAEPSSQAFSYTLSNPSDLEVTRTWYLDGVAVGTASAYTFPGGYATSGSYNVTARVASSQNTLQRTWLLTVTDTPQEETNSSVSITGSSTDLPESGGEYDLWETGTGTFSVTLDGSATITWAVDGVVVETDTGTGGTFAWLPGILFTDQVAHSTVSATVGSQTVQWPVRVVNVINPFFSSGFGAEQATLEILTNNNALTFTSVSVAIASSAGTTPYELAPTLSGFETVWQHSFTAQPGDNWLVLITGTDEVAGTTSTYTLSAGDRGHYRTGPGGDTGGSGGSGGAGSGGRQSLGGGGGGGGGGGAAPAQNSPTPQLVYVALAKDVIGLGEEQEITLDAKVGTGAITGVSATFLTPQNTERKERLELQSGTGQYGTWSATFGGFELGKYPLSSITLTTQNGSLTVRIKDRSFYVGEDTVGEEFSLIYAVLDQSSVKNGTTVTLRADVRDTEGITEATATVTTSKGDSFSIPLKRTQGTAQYGTWEGEFIVQEPDTTYAVTDITLSRSAEQFKKVGVTGRTVYVAPVPRIEQQNLITGNAIFSREWASDLVRKPLVPTFVGFSVMLLAMGGIALGAKMRRQSKRE